MRSPVLTGRFLKFKPHSFRLNMIYISKKNQKFVKGVLGGKNHEFFARTYHFPANRLGVSIITPVNGERLVSPAYEASRLTGSVRHRALGPRIVGNVWKSKDWIRDWRIQQGTEQSMLLGQTIASNTRHPCYSGKQDRAVYTKPTIPDVTQCQTLVIRVIKCSRAAQPIQSNNSFPDHKQVGSAALRAIKVSAPEPKAAVPN